MSKVVIICKFCGTKKEVDKYEHDRGQHKYCSQNCFQKDKLTQFRGVDTKERLCETCGKTFIAKRIKTRFCSPKCRSKYHSIWVKQNQGGENNPFYGKKHTIETKEHLHAIKKEMFARGTLIPHNKGKIIDNPVPKRDRIWKMIRDKVLKLDNYSCVLCGSNINLEVHHIIPYRDIRKHNIGNLVTLCKKCHNKLCKKENTVKDILEKITIKRNTKE